MTSQGSNYLRTALFNQSGKMRNGWWIVIFILGIIATNPIYRLIKQQLGSIGMTEQHMDFVSPMLLLLVTWLCCKLRSEKLSNVGLSLNRQWFAQFGLGSALGMLQILLVVACIWLIGGVTLELNPEASLQIAMTGVYLFLMASILEELLHRGFIFQRLIDGLGVWLAQLLIGALFAFGHWDNPGMEGSTQIWATLDLFVGSLFWGFAYIRTGSLALPIGLHLGWNWCQGNLLGFGVSGLEMNGIWQPTFNDTAQWLTGGDFGPEASIFALITDCIMLFLVWRWKGVSPKQESSQQLTAPVPAV